jgi:hypothetical protein
LHKPLPSSSHIDISQYFESSNEEDISAKPGGSSIDLESSTSKISAAAGIPEYLLKGLDVSTPEEALEKLLSGGSLNTNSEGTSAPLEDDKELQLEQELWEARFKDEFLQRDVLDIIDSLNQLRYSSTDSGVLRLTPANSLRLILVCPT